MQSAPVWTDRQLLERWPSLSPYSIWEVQEVCECESETEIQSHAFTSELKLLPPPRPTVL